MKLKFEQLAVFAKSEKEFKSVVLILKQSQLCPLCILRCLGERNPLFYSYPLSDVECLINSYIPNDESSGNLEDILPNQNGFTFAEVDPTSIISCCNSSSSFCTLCLGILQHEFLAEEFVGKIENHVIQEGYDASEYSICLSLPASILLREHAMWILLRDKFKSIYLGRDKDDMVPMRDIWRWLNCAKLNEKLKAEEVKKSKFDIALNFDHPEEEKECSFLCDVFPDNFKKRKGENHGFKTFTKMGVLRALGNMSSSQFLKNYQCPPRQHLIGCRSTISTIHESIFVAGRYLKFSRFLSQTPWLIDGKRKTETSVEELIADHLTDFFHPKDHKFASAGREDVDVKCLGNGRPFVLELVNPCKSNVKQADLTEIEKKINSATDLIAVKYLQIVERDKTSIIKDGEEEKTKTYTATCYCLDTITQEELNKLESIKDLVLNQKTPVRVLHRRPLMSRKKTVHCLSAKTIDEKHFKLSIKTQAGTYIKEFVHGDLGRTSPNLGSLLQKEFDISELDVESVDIDWPSAPDPH